MPTYSHHELARAFLRIINDADAAEAQGGLVALLADTPEPTLKARADTATAAFLLAKAIVTAPGLLDNLIDGTAVANLVIANKNLMGACASIIEKCVFLAHRNDDPDASIIGSRASSWTHEALLEILNMGRPVIGLFADAAKVPDTLSRAADYIVEIGTLDQETIQFAIEIATGERPTRSVNARAVAALSFESLTVAIRRQWTAQQCVDRIELAVVPADSKAPSAAPPIRVDDLGGFGAAKTWAQELVDDVRAYRAGDLSWEDFEHFALLLSGPPGCGKTEFAAAVARAAELPFIATSVSEWHAGNHLGQTIKAIQAKFAEARAKAPVLMLIDEIDGISNRATLAGEHLTYWTQIVNLVLEELTKENRGVVIIGATNFPDRIDPAIRRSGRLDRHIAVELPTFEEMPGIFRLHLGDALEGVDLVPVALLAAGGSGADAAAWVKRAKNAARRVRRPVVLNDLIKAVKGDSAPLSDKAAWRIAVHEAGHLVAMTTLNAGVLHGASISNRGGSAIVDPQFSGGTTRAEVEDHVAILLAGRLAEVLVLRSFGIGSGMGENSDLSRATELSVMLEVQAGAGRFGLVNAPAAHMDVLRNPALLAAVRDRLDMAEAKAASLLKEHESLLREIALHLSEHRYISASQVEALVGRNNRIEELVS